MTDDSLREQLRKDPTNIDMRNVSRDKLLDRQYVRPGQPFNMRGWLRGEGPHEVVFVPETPAAPVKPEQ